MRSQQPRYYGEIAPREHGDILEAMDNCRRGIFDDLAWLEWVFDSKGGKMNPWVFRTSAEELRAWRRAADVAARTDSGDAAGPDHPE